MTSRSIIFSAIILLLSGCMKEELPVPRQPRGEAKTVSLCMGSAYQDQVWVDLGTASIVSTNPKTAWDLSFESDANGWRIMLNGSKGMAAWNIGNADISEHTDTVGMAIAKKIDASSGHPDSTAFGDWRNSGNVYVIDLGFGVFGNALGLRKVKPVQVNSSSYVMEVSSIDGTGLATVTVQKDPTRSFTHYSFSNGAVSIGPQRGAWDLVFTQYTYQFQEPFIAYIVTGVLSDRNTTRIARISGKPFADVTLSDTLQAPFSNARDAIGFDWKDYSFETSSYTLRPNLSFIIKDVEGAHFKMQFIDFYSDQGQAGCPKFEVVPL